MKVNVISTVPEFDPDINVLEISIPSKSVYDDAEPGDVCNFEAQFSDIASSGEIGSLADSEWRREALEKLFETLTPAQKVAFFVYTIENMVNNEGWMIEDIEYLKELCGVESFQAVFTS